MRGNTRWQVNQALDELDNFGMSKHEIKLSMQESGIKDWHEIGQSTGIFHSRTKDSYRDAILQFCNWAKAEYGIKDITKLDANHASQWLEKKIFADGIALKTFNAYASALEKFSIGLEQLIGKEYNWSANINQMREIAHNVCGNEHIDRAFKNPMAVIEATSPEFRIYAEIQYFCGCRINEIHTLRIDDEGRYWVTGKGNYTREVFPPDNLKSQIITHIAESGMGLTTKAEQDEYRNAIKSACLQTGEHYSGSHSFRHNFSQEKFSSCLAEGKGYHRSLQETSAALGHHREDVVKIYYLK